MLVALVRWTKKGEVDELSEEKQQYNKSKIEECGIQREGVL